MSVGLMAWQGCCCCEAKYGQCGHAGACLQLSAGRIDMDGGLQHSVVMRWKDSDYTGVGCTLEMGVRFELLAAMWVYSDFVRYC